jgi:hypothetical protein
MKQSTYTANGHLGHKAPRKVIAESVQFTQISKFVHFNLALYLIVPCRRIGRDLSQTCAKLEKLAELARKRSLFDDRQSEVEELTMIVKQVSVLLKLFCTYLMFRTYKD